jgi:transketolase
MQNHPFADHTVNVIKGLIMDGTRKANSGHPGGAMSSADMAYVLFRSFLKYDPENTDWPNRDRFVLSAGHESMLLYSLLHLQGYLDIDELRRFRQLNSLTPGHPEADLTPGVEATTGPLGQGISMAVGMALAEAHLNAKFGKSLIDHYT